MNDITYISYTSHDEIIITTPDREKATLEAYFTEKSGRDYEDYDRNEHREDAIAIIPQLRVRWG